MKAILVKEKGGPENLVVEEYRKPECKEGFVLIRIKAFGLNRADIYMRKGQFGETPDIIGIECVGIIEEDLSGRFRKGQQVAAMVGGMARSLNGGYAEYITVPGANVIPFKSKLPWDQLAAIPETYATAWAILHWCLDAQPREQLLIRGGTSTVGMAAIILARQLGMRVVATTRSAEKVRLLRELGAGDVFIDRSGPGAQLSEADRQVSSLKEQLSEKYPDGVDKLMELVGTSTLEDSFSLVRPKGTLCLAGFLGGMTPIDNFQPIFQIPNGIRLSTLASAFSFGQKGFEFGKIPLQQIITDIEEKRIPNILRRTFRVADIREAHRLIENNEVNGKVVVEW